MLNNYYRTVFQTVDSPFNAENNFYNVILNYSGGAEYNEALKREISHYIGSVAITEYDLSLEDTSDDYIESILRERVTSQYGIGYDSCYSLIFDYENTDISDKVVAAVNLIKKLISVNILGKNDRVSLIVTLPDNDSASVYMKSLEKAGLPADVMLYVFQKRRYFEQRMINNICSVIMLSSDKSYCMTIENNRRKTDVFVETAISAFPEEGRNQIKQHPEFYWSTISTFYNDDKMDFLRRYLYNICKCSVRYDSVNFANLCDEYFQRQINIPDTGSWTRKLEHAIKLIPRCASNVKIDEETTLRGYYELMYGFNGIDAVELTLKANLTKFLPFTNAVIADAARFIFTDASQYHSTCLFDDVKTMLISLMKHLDGLNKTEYEAIEPFTRNCGNMADVQRDYINKYIQYTVGIRRRMFWEEVYDYISIHRDEFSEYCKVSGDLAANLARTEQELSLSKNIPMGSLSFPKYTAKKILECDPQVCESIMNAYDQILMMGTAANVASVQQHDPFIGLYSGNNNFFQDFDYDFTVRGTYTINVRQRIGKYCLFGDL